VAAAIAGWCLGVRYIPHNRIGIVEQFWSPKGGVRNGRIIALNQEAGFQAEVLRGGLHFFYFRFRYRIHLQPLVTIGEGRIGYIYARDGRPLAPAQTLGAVVPCNNFQDARAFFELGGQRGRQRGILREGVYAINTAAFVVITEDRVHSGPFQDGKEQRYMEWRTQLQNIFGFYPVIIGFPQQAEEVQDPSPTKLLPHDQVGVVTVHDGPPLESSEIIAPEIGSSERSHSCFQDTEAFLELGGKRGKQVQVISDGTFFINRWFATVEARSKTLIPVGYVGVVVSYHGVEGEDVTGADFRYGLQVEHGHRGVLKNALPPGKYALNPYAYTVVHVPTTNFVLRWITGQTENHRYDEDLRSIELITADGYEPKLPLSLVLHIDYEKAPRVVQRFGDVNHLITQTLDPILSAYFRDVAQHLNMLDLLTKREEIQRLATTRLGERFREYDINCIAVKIGRPESQGSQYAPGQDPIEHLFDQLRQRRLADEQIETYKKQEFAAEKQRELNSARAAAEKEAELRQTKIAVEIAANKGEAQLAESRRLAERDVVRAEAEARAKEAVARGEGRARELVGQGEANRIRETGLAEAQVFQEKVRAYGDPRLFALQGVSDRLASSVQPLVPRQVFTNGGNGENGNATGLFGQLLALLVAEKAATMPQTAEMEPEAERPVLETAASGTDSAK
jgi:uncharacterized membrane protein YqiK